MIDEPRERQRIADDELSGRLHARLAADPLERGYRERLPLAGPVEAAAF